MEDELVPFGDLSFVGSLRRLELIDRLKNDVRHPSEEQIAAVDSEAKVKKMVAEQLQSLSASGMTSLEKELALKFLDAQLKSVEQGVAGADKRTAKLSELRSGVVASSSAEEPAHVRKARAEVPRAEKAYAEIHKNYEKWEKGKQMLSVDELKVLKRNHEDGQQRLEIAKQFIEAQLERHEQAAAPLPDILASRSAPSAGVGSKAKAVSKASNSNVRGGGPAMRVSGTIGVGQGPPARQQGAGYPSTAAFLQAEAAAAMRLEQEQRERERAAAAETQAAPRQRQSQPKPKVEEEGPVLSFACTLTAVAEHLGVREDDARAIASSSSEFKAHFDPHVWEIIRDRSLAIEQEKRDAAREKEKHKSASALARATDRMPMPGIGVAQATPAKSAGAGAAAANRPKAAADAKSKAKPKGQPAAPTKKGAGLATKNAFSGLGGDDDDSDEDDGFTRVRR